MITRIKFEKLNREVDVYQNFKSAGILAAPHCAEITDIRTGGNVYHVDCGLQFENKTLIDADGSFALPKCVGAALVAMGFNVPAEFYIDGETPEIVNLRFISRKSDLIVYSVV